MVDETTLLYAHINTVTLTLFCGKTCFYKHIFLCCLFIQEHRTVKKTFCQFVFSTYFM